MKQAILFLFMIQQLTAQTIFSGLVKDSVNLSVIPFASIGVVGRPYGTLTDENGIYQLNLDSPFEKDSIRVWAIGYKAQTFSSEGFKNRKDFFLSPLANVLEEVIVGSTKTKTTYLGDKKYTTNNCSGFIKNSTNWKGSEAAVLAGNKEGRTVLLETFSFYIIKNLYEDSLRFRLMLYEASPKKYPRLKTLMRKPVIFKVGKMQGEFTLDLRKYNISSSSDFFISLECLSEELDISKFCFAASVNTPTYVKPAAFEKWTKIRGGGPEFNVKVSYEK